MPERFCMGPGKIYITTADGTTAFEGLKEACMVEETHNDCFPPEPNAMMVGDYNDFAFNVEINDEVKAHLLGFKNTNCMHRAVRRRKRWEEKERRRRLKEGNKDG